MNAASLKFLYLQVFPLVNEVYNLLHSEGKTALCELVYINTNFHAYMENVRNFGSLDEFFTVNKFIFFF